MIDTFINEMYQDYLTPIGTPHRIDVFRMILHMASGLAGKYLKVNSKSAIRLEENHTNLDIALYVQFVVK